MPAQRGQNIGLADVAGLRKAIANITAEAGRTSTQDPALARILVEMDVLIENVEASCAQRKTGPGLPGLREANEMQRVSERIQHELSASGQALESMEQARAGLLRVNAPKPADGFRYRPSSRASVAKDPVPSAEPDRAVAIVPESSWSMRYGGVVDALFVCRLTADLRLDRFVDVNEAACRLLGYSREELLEMSLADVDGAAGALDMEAVVSDALAGKSVVRETVHMTRDGRCIPVLLHVHALGTTGRPAVLALARDLTAHAHAEDQLRLWQKAFDASADAIVITDSQERILSVNPAVTEITGYTAEEAIGKTPRIFSSGRHDREFYRGMWAALMSVGHWHGEIWDRRKNGEIYPKWLSITAVPDHQGRVTHYIASFSDITVRKNYEEKIRFLAYHDPLTGLPNRRLLKDRFEIEIAHARRNGCKLHLLFLDLDRFKEINDTLGHAVGDKFLLATTGRFKSCLRETDIISRLGGDEFVIVLSDMHGTVELPHVMDKLYAGLAEPFDIEGNELKASTSVGIAVFPNDGADFETLLDKADTAMYHVKRQRRGSYLYFDEGMNSAAQERIVLESHLRNALENGEIFLHYQPQVHLGSGRLSGVEGMLRWESPILGAVHPDQFIPLAEDSGLMAKIGAWALREVCRQAREWHLAGWSDLTVSFKLGPAQCGRKDIVPIMERALAETGVAPSRIALGFPETSLVHGSSALMKSVLDLKALGIRLFLDGYGCGCASPSFLRRSAMDCIKVDRTLIASLPDNPDNVAIVRAALQVAHCLNLDVIADGIGNEAQLELLRESGCHLGQGPLFGHPQADPLPARLN